MKNTVLITGGAGFIGSHTADYLLLKGYNVILYDNLNNKSHTGDWPSYVNPLAEKLFGDVLDSEKLSYAISRADYIIHLAAEMDLNPDFQKFMNINVGSTALIYELILKNKYPVKKVIVASSQFVYGEGIWQCLEHGDFPATNRSKESLLMGMWDQYCPVCKKKAQYCNNKETYQNPPNHYALSKYFQEKIAMQLGILYSIPSVALRYSIVHGPRQSLKNTYSGALRTFAISISLGHELATFEDNMSMRDFVSVFDIASANLLVLESDDANYQVFNVGGGKSWTIYELANLLARKMNSPFSFSKKQEFRVGDIRHAISDISKIQRLGWCPESTEEQTISLYIDWFKQQKVDFQSFLHTQSYLREAGIILSKEK
jgi:dTDP-L-rhamnose 4-epimerase